MKKNVKRWKRFPFVFPTIFILVFMAAGAMAQGPIIIDHNCTDLSLVPDYWIAQARTVVFHYAHTSHGGQITWGLQQLSDMDPRYNVNI